MDAEESHPELVFGISGAIGVDMEQIATELSNCLITLGYEHRYIKLTSEMTRFGEVQAKPRNTFEAFNSKMDYANGLRKRFGSADTMARIAIDAIRRTRESRGGSADQPISRIAYIIRQFKLPQEIALMRNVYGERFVLISAYGSQEDRKDYLCSLMKPELETTVTDDELETHANTLIRRDANESQDMGQNLRETFHLADLFVDGMRQDKMRGTLRRFTEALFGLNSVSPTRDEHGMFMAKAASWRSTDLSRQVGSHIATKNGETIAVGCNEVPKAYGGNYWDEDKDNFRDVNIGHDPNDRIKREVLRNLVECMRRGGLLSEKATNIGSDIELVARLTSKPPKDTGNLLDGVDGALSEALVMDLTEYGRVVHAEMNAICEAARLGKSLSMATLYCTTFPCHNCTKHILASGITRVVYMEPYPKSRARELHGNEVAIEDQQTGKISFEPFIGISPLRYQDIFEKGKRKAQGKAVRWYHHSPRPMVDTPFADQQKRAEQWALSILVGKVLPDESVGSSTSSTQKH
ncbi:anti-phage dCTP deaminase [Aestuariivirga sp.]|uniref:anti-phage dCTP deaminase n=1 Tax=Aestuariivirga sp. TaxID=2650926 RepID=UPI0025C5994B|nr:anti-phage dCTP deaminase [Aestuariivirga sp.]MCA3555950.1 deoxycytidylate deaminase [Aestuariivirga sp.]